MVAAASVLLRSQPGAAPAIATDEVTAGYATPLLRELGGPSAARLPAAARAAAFPASDEIVWCARWRQALHAVELCQRAAEMAARQ